MKSGWDIIFNKSILSVLLYLSSFFLTTWNNFAGWRIFIMGIATLFYKNLAPYFICWFANVLFWICQYRMLKYKSSGLLSIIALLLALLYPVLLIVSEQTKIFNQQEARIQIGYYIWLSSFILMVLLQVSSYKNEINLTKK